MALREFSTSFQATENPIAEAINAVPSWVTGKTRGGSWGNVQTQGGNAFCDVFTTGQNDSTCYMNPAIHSIPADQEVSAVIRRLSSYQPPDGQEAELFFRANSTGIGNWRGYELTWEFPFNGTGQVFWVRWDGNLDAAVVLDGVSIGDVPDKSRVRGSAIGNTLTAYSKRRPSAQRHRSHLGHRESRDGVSHESPAAILDGFCFSDWGARAARTLLNYSNIGIANGRTTMSPIAVPASFSHLGSTLDFSSFPLGTALTVLQQVSVDGGATWRDFAKVAIPSGGRLNRLGGNTLFLQGSVSDVIPAGALHRHIIDCNAALSINTGRSEAFL
jgi:hypothetical protein